MEDCTKEEIDTGSYYNTENKHLVIIEDHRFVKEHLPYVLAHELAHYYYHTPEWVLRNNILTNIAYFIEEFRITFLGGWKKFLVKE